MHDAKFNEHWRNLFTLETPLLHLIPMRVILLFVPSNLKQLFFFGRAGLPASAVAPTNPEYAIENPCLPIKRQSGRQMASRRK